jgi:hypothetical protein
MQYFEKLILIAFICLVYVDSYDATSYRFSRNSNIRTCYTANDCLKNEFCVRFRKYSNLHKCRLKINDGLGCYNDNHCLSNHCHRFKCIGKQIGSDVSPYGRCDKHEDCRFEQYCSNLKCKDRQREGWCSNDGQCLSNHCSYFRCNDPVIL